MSILIVDDSESLRTQLRKDLESAKFKVVEAEDGLEALSRLHEHSKEISLVICDVNMPRMDGLSFCAKVREMSHFKALPILMMTTESSSDLKAQGKNLGVLAWITKPYVAEKLIGVLKKLIP